MVGHWLAFSLPLLAVLAVLAYLFPTEQDVAFHYYHHRAAHPDIKFWLKLLTDWGNAAFYLICAAYLVVGIRRGDRAMKRFALCWIVMQLIVAGLMVHGIKMFIGRPRPGEGIWFNGFTTSPQHHSFPSGHTTEFTGWVSALAFRWARPALSLFFGLLLALMGFSRIYLGWHHPTDVFFGWLLGSVTGLAVHLFATKE